MKYDLTFVINCVAFGSMILYLIVNIIPKSKKMDKYRIKEVMKNGETRFYPQELLFNFMGLRMYINITDPVYRDTDESFDSLDKAKSFIEKYRKGFYEKRSVKIHKI